MSSSNFLKKLGEGSDAAGQLSIDKAIKRKATSTTRGAGIVDGEYVEGTTKAGVVEIPHNLRRLPEGGSVVLWEPGGSGEVFVEAVTVTSVRVRANGVGRVKVWVA